MCTRSWIWGGVGGTFLSSARRRLLGAGERVTLLGNPRGTSKVSEGVTHGGAPVELPCSLRLAVAVRRSELGR